MIQRVWQAGAIAIVLAAASSARADQDCRSGAIQRLGAIAEAATGLFDDQTSILSIELFQHRSDPCRSAYLLSALTDDGDVVQRAIDARLLTPIDIDEEDEDDWRHAGDDREDALETFPVRSVFVGSEESDHLVGLPSDDTFAGGPGADVFTLSVGDDVILDFDPGEDLLDVSVFAHRHGGYETLTSISMIARNSVEDEMFDRNALIIGVEGEEDGWVTVLLGVSIDALTAENVIFDAEGAWPQGLAPARAPEALITGSDGSVVYVHAYKLEEGVGEVELVIGEEAAKDQLVSPRDW